MARGRGFSICHVCQQREGAAANAENVRFLDFDQGYIYLSRLEWVNIALMDHTRIVTTLDMKGSPLVDGPRPEIRIVCAMDHMQTDREIKIAYEAAEARQMCMIRGGK